MGRLHALRRFARGVWFRATIVTSIGVLAAVLAVLLSALAPDAAFIDLGQGSVSTLLQILAAAMLAVTTFSLTAVVQAVSGAATNGTPRSTQLLLEDPTSQNALSTFIGAFAFSIVGVVGLSVGSVREAGRTALFVVALVVIGIVLVTLLRWVAFLPGFGRMSDIIDRVEAAAVASADAYRRSPRLGAAPWTAPPSAAVPVGAAAGGRIVAVDVPALQRLAEGAGCEIHVLLRPGARTVPGLPVALVTGPMDAGLAASVADAFRIGRHREFESDPRLGVLALSEIGERAMSSAINDPGTAIEVLAAMQRVLQVALDVDGSAEVIADRVRMSPIDPADFVVDGLRSLARDGAGSAEVVARLLAETRLIERGAPPEARTALSSMLAEIERRARTALTDPADLGVVDAALRPAPSAADNGPYETVTRTGYPGAMANLRLEELSAATAAAANSLTLRPGQEEFVTPPTYELADGAVDPLAAWPRVVLDGDEVVGFILGNFQPDAAQEELRACVWRVTVRGDRQGEGIGTFAVRALAEEARSRGFARITTLWEPGEAGPDAFFRAVGFSVERETQYGENFGTLTL